MDFNISSLTSFVCKMEEGINDIISQVYSCNDIVKTQRLARKCSADTFTSFIVVFITHNPNREIPELETCECLSSWLGPL